MTDLFIDIETIPLQDPEKVAILVRDVEVLPPGTMKLQPTIDKWYEEKYPGILKIRQDAAIRTTQLQPYLGGEICCIGWAIDDSEIYSTTRRSTDSESDYLKAFWNVLKITLEEGKKRDAQAGQRPEDWYVNIRWCGHYITNFDLPFLFARCLIHDVMPCIPIPYNEREWNRRIFDTHYQATGGKRGIEGAGLKPLSQSMGEEVLEMSPAEIEEAWRGDDERLARYCESDVKLTRDLANRIDRIMFPIGGGKVE